VSRWLLLGLVLPLGCGPRPWNYDETHRIAEVMRQGDEEPQEEAFSRSLAAEQMPPLAPYSPPVFVRPRNESRRKPEVFRRRKYAPPALWKPTPPSKANPRAQGR